MLLMSSALDVKANLVAGRSPVTAVQSDLLFTPRLAFDDADVQLLLTSQGLTWLAILTRAVIQTIVE
jgi:hypothetical protein